MSKVQLLAGEAQSGERSAAIQACNDWLRMGPGRSLAELHRKYTGSHQDAPPTESLDTIKGWSSRYDWAERAEGWDAGAEDRKTAAYDMAMKTGLAQDFERVNELKKLARFLIEQIYERGTDGAYHNVWVPDVKVVGYGDDAQVVDIERFNAAIIRELRGALDDIAQETGGRVKQSKHELTGAEGGPIEHNITERVDAALSKAYGEES